MGKRKFLTGILLFSFLLIYGAGASAADMSVTLAWDPNNETDLAGYNLYYSTIQGGPYEGVGSSDGDSPIVIPLSSLADPANPRFTVHGLPGSAYYFVVTAYNTHGLESTFSNEVSASAPVTQYQLSASVGSGSGTISPTSGTYNAGTVVTLTATPASGYRVASWTGTDNNSSTATTNTVTMSANRSVTASFSTLADENPIEVIQVIPVNDIGIDGENKGVQDNAAFAVRLESLNGMDIANPNAVTFTIRDGNSAYTRRLGDLNEASTSIMQAMPLDADGNIAYHFWAVYYRTNETAMLDRYLPGSVVEVTVNARDTLGELMEPVTFRFKVQSEEEKSAEMASLPETSVTIDNATGTKIITVVTGPLAGASILFDNTLLQEIGIEPYFGPAGSFPPLTGVGAVGAPLNLLPDMVFPTPVTLLISCPGYDDPSGLEIYYFDGREWRPAYDNTGNVKPGGEGWVVPGSRINHNKTQDTLALIEIQVYHFSAALAAETETATLSAENASGGGGCFISVLGIK